jgi:hypothetical protein
MSDDVLSQCNARLNGFTSEGEGVMTSHKKKNYISLYWLPVKVFLTRSLLPPLACFGENQGYQAETSKMTIKNK